MSSSQVLGASPQSGKLTMKSPSFHMPFSAANLKSFSVYEFIRFCGIRAILARRVPCHLLPQLVHCFGGSGVEDETYCTICSKA
jgi:hypothetical protein